MTVPIVWVPVPVPELVTVPIGLMGLVMRLTPLGMALLLLMITVAGAGHAAGEGE